MGLNSSTNRKWTHLFRIWTHFNFFLVQVSMCSVVVGGGISSEMEIIFLFRSQTRLSCKAMCTVTPKQHNCRFLVLKRNIQNVAAGFAFFTVIETSRLFGLNVNTFFVSTCWTKHISDNLSYFVVHTQFFLFLFG